MFVPPDSSSDVFSEEAVLTEPVVRDSSLDVSCSSNDLCKDPLRTEIQHLLSGIESSQEREERTEAALDMMEDLLRKLAGFRMDQNTKKRSPPLTFKDVFKAAKNVTALSRSFVLLHV